MTSPVRFIHISDTHLGPTADYQLAGCTTLPNVKRVIEAINHLPLDLDFVIHTGDVVTNPHLESYKLAARVFAELRAPIYFVAGNHDRSRDILAHLKMGRKMALSNHKNRVSYAFEKNGYRFLTLDARGPDSIDPHGVLDAGQLEILHEEVRTGEKPFVVFIHFPPLQLDSAWYDREMLLLNGAAFHEALRPAQDRLRGVFFGHVHRGMQVYKDGILYSGVPSTCRQFYAWPGDETAQFDNNHPPGFNVVTLSGGQTIIKTHLLPPP